MSERLPLRMPGSADPQDCALWYPPEGESREKLGEALRVAGVDPKSSIERGLADVPPLPPLPDMLDSLESESVDSSQRVS
jgi:hypothetical protein